MSSQTVTKKPPRRTKVAGKPNIYRSSSGRLEIAYRANGKLQWFACPRGWSVTDAVNKRNELNVQKTKGELAIPSKWTVEEAAEKWLAEFKEEWAPRTHESRESTLRLHIIPVIGSVKLRDLTSDHVWKVAEAMKGKGAAKSSRNLALSSVLSPFFAWLVDEGELKSNPAAGLSKNRRKRLSDAGSAGQPKKVIEDQAALLRAVDAPFALIVKTALLTGLRLAEVLGLRLCDLGDGKDGTIRVDGQLDRKTRWHTPRVKTPSSRRTVRDVPEALLAELRAAGPNGPEALVFTDKTGRGRWAQVVERAFDRAVKDVGLDESLVFHCTRHTAASRWIAEGRSPVYVQKQLGHKSLRTTLDIYAHEFDAREQRDESRLAADEAYAALTLPVRPTLTLVEAVA
jgi:integrase